jgi:hypothetical protein
MESVHATHVMAQPAKPAYAERRAHARSAVQNGCIACCELTAVGHIIDISPGGLAFRYVASTAQTKGPSRLRILVTDRSFCLEEIPFRTVWDLAMPGEFSLGPITLRYCGVQFQDLTKRCKTAVRDFIRNHTLARVSESRAHGYDRFETLNLELDRVSLVPGVEYA